MTIEHAPSTNGRVHTDDTAPSEPRAFEAGDPDFDTSDGGGLGKLIMPLLLIAVALLVLRRLTRGEAGA
jgi:hypothetical protein